MRLGLAVMSWSHRPVGRRGGGGGGEEVEVVHTTGYWPHPYTPGFAGHSTRLCLVLYTLLDHSIP